MAFESEMMIVHGQDQVQCLRRENIADGRHSAAIPESGLCWFRAFSAQLASTTSSKVAFGHLAADNDEGGGNQLLVSGFHKLTLILYSPHCQK
jgi:hypothetical protein